MVVFNEENPYKNSETVSIVGNGPSILNLSPHKIDDSEEVWRINHAPTKGFSNIVGSRETGRILNRTLQTGNSGDGGDPPSDWISTIRDKTLILKPGRRPKIVKNKIHDSCEVLSLTPDTHKKFKREVANQYKANKPSTGIFAVWLATLIFERIETFGFDFYDSTQAHYWDDDLKADGDVMKGHDFNKDYEVFNELMKDYG